MGKIQKIKSRILVDWPEGRDAEPRVLTCTPTMEEAIKLEQVVRDAFRLHSALRVVARGRAQCN